MPGRVEILIVRTSVQFICLREVPGMVACTSSDGDESAEKSRLKQTGPKDVIEDTWEQLVKVIGCTPIRG